MADLDRATARALVEAGYMPLSIYVQLFGEASAHAEDAPLVPDPDTKPVAAANCRDMFPHH